jgi:phosphate transport system substrate-binding protein
MKNIRNYFLALITLSIPVLTGCGGSADNTTKGDEEEVELAGDIQIDGSSTVFPITEAVAEEFRNENPKVKITIGVSGTGGGFKKFGRGEIDIADASRSIKDKEAEECAASNIKYLELSVAFDGLAVIANPENTWLTDITIEELKMIWEPAAQGNIMKWNQIRKEWPDEEIHLFGPGVASGTFDYFTEVIVGKAGDSRGDYTASEDDNVLVQGVAGDKYALGFFGLAYYEENKDKLKLISVNSGTGAISPTNETVKNGTYAPLSRPLFIYVTDKAAQRPEVRAFVEFYLEMAKELVAEAGYIPLSDEEYAKQVEKFKSFTGK